MVNLQLGSEKAENYTSSSQKIRVLTEAWVNENMYCPYCGSKKIKHFENNRPVADFFCTHRKEEYELKSKAGKIGNKVCDGAYDTMISRIQSINNPNFFLLQYKKKDLRVHNFIMIPKHFFVSDLVEKRKPLAETAKRAGWIGCNIVVGRIPEEGKIYVVKNGQPIPADDVISKLHRTSFIAEFKLENRG